MLRSFAQGALAFAISVATAVASAQNTEKLGSLSFPNTCSDAVRPKLQRAMALLHSFWWSEGHKAFREVWSQDPSCAIADWGIATLAIGNPHSRNHTGWSQESSVNRLGISGGNFVWVRLPWPDRGWA